MKEHNCTFEKCRYNEDLCCTKLDEFYSCKRGCISTFIEKVYVKYPNDKDIWLLLQAVASLGVDINKIKKEFAIK